MTIDLIYYIDSLQSVSGSDRRNTGNRLPVELSKDPVLM